jgi:hypothetical protein
MKTAVRDIPVRRERRDGVLQWPERAIGRDPAINLAEVESALTRRRRRKPPPPLKPASLRRDYSPYGPPLTGPLLYNGERLSYEAAGRLVGITGPAMFKRVRRHGWPGALNKAKKEPVH